jgi:nitrite reductase/ring-hydroxylating ferredoxin subunit
LSIYTFYKTNASFSNLEESKPIEASTGDKSLCLLLRNGQIHAFAALCPHAGIPLCAGWLDGLGRIVCPKHKYRFDPATGRNTSGEGYKLFTYPVEIRDNEIFVGFMDNDPPQTNIDTQQSKFDIDDDVDRW